MTKSWLHVYLVESVRKRMCTRIYCTTGGAMEFRLGVVKALANSTGKPPKEYFDWDNETELACTSPNAQHQRRRCTPSAGCCC